ncbi:unnamed protein product [Periconia digitata]|uniref:Uncharacterized protein n=1 Tax=Periconia digitata TaxID=1303443 RepID=A0A9W4UPN6_9PLEO|nr:unnamed protein product [Periconia digitata]
MADNPKKREHAGGNGPPSKRPRFPFNPNHNIRTTPTNTAYPNGEINVRNFLKSHENEIKSLENAMQAAKKGLNRRAFQNVPRGLRRRTASHNPQRVPKRLRTQAKREMKEDNTPISKGASGIGKSRKKWLRKDGIERSRQAWDRRAKRRKEKKEPSVTVEPMEGVETEGGRTEPPTAPRTKTRTTTTADPKSIAFSALATPEIPPSRFRRRQINKTWLPTHVWHAKRARMTPPANPLWGFSIPLVQNEKAYRSAYHAKSKGALTCDTSYMATLSLKGPEASILGLLKALHFADEDDEDPWANHGKWKKWRNGTRAWEGWLYERQSEPLSATALVTVIWCVQESDSNTRRVFIRVHPGAFHQLWNTVIRVSKVQKPAVIAEDLRFEIGSIEITGRAAHETLCSILHPRVPPDMSSQTPDALWQSLATIATPDDLPSGALVAFPITDPRLRDPPSASSLSYDASAQDALTETLAQWPIDTTQTVATVFDRNSRLAAARSLQSQQSINRRKSPCTKGEYPDPRSSDPHIPMLTYASRNRKSWTVLLPWKCVPPVWQGIMRYHLSTGENPLPCGLKESRDIQFMESIPNFPYDFPGTVAGWDWEMKERAAREHEWKKRPKGKRIEWSTIDLGNGRRGEVGDPWACAWEKLCSKEHNDLLTCEIPNSPRPCFRQLPSQDASAVLKKKPIASSILDHNYLVTVKITMSKRGTPTDCARIYRLPTNNSDLRNKWLSLVSKDGSVRNPRPMPKEDHDSRSKVFGKRGRRQKLAENLLQPAPKKEDDYPSVPDEEDLIGFVTTGNYNLAEGVPTAIANLMLSRVFTNNSEGLSRDDTVCIVREAGHTIGRLATWESV